MPKNLMEHLISASGNWHCSLLFSSENCFLASGTFKWSNDFLWPPSSQVRVKQHQQNFDNIFLIQCSLTSWSFKLFCLSTLLTANMRPKFYTKIMGSQFNPLPDTWENSFAHEGHDSVSNYCYQVRNELFHSSCDPSDLSWDPSEVPTPGWQPKNCTKVWYPAI